MSGLKSKLIVSGAVVLLAAGYLVNEYVYSFAGAASNGLGLCESKLIRASGPGEGFKRLGYPVDLAASAAALSSNPNYAVVYDGDSLSVSRAFGKLKYTIRFENRMTDAGRAVFHQYSISCPDCPASETGEDCGTANFRIYKNVYKMLDDLPLGHREEYELRSNLMIYSREMTYGPDHRRLF